MRRNRSFELHQITGLLNLHLILLGLQKRNISLPLVSYLYEYCSVDRRLTEEHQHHHNLKPNLLAFLGYYLDILCFLQHTNHCAD